MKKTCKNKDKKCVSYGGQAVIEGVYMRGKTAEAIAVRDEDGVIRTESKRIKPLSEKNVFFRLPIIRGVVAFITSLSSGMTTLMRSAEVYGEGEPTKFEKWVAKKLKINVMSVVSAFALIIGLVGAVLLFIFLPQVVRRAFEQWFNGGNAFGVWARNFIEGGVKLLIFVLYILLVSLLKDIRRTFMYHGAEHKTIACYEKGLDLTVENAKTCTRVHPRCGTTFIVFVLVISIIVFAVFEALIGTDIKGVLRVLCKIALLPVVAGLSYELLKFLANRKSFVFYPLKVPGFLLQLLTTREPDDKMLEVAITSLTAVIEMDNDNTVPERRFDFPKKRSDVLDEVKSSLKENGIDEDAEAEWILCCVLKIKRDEVKSDALVSVSDQMKIKDLVKKRITGRPLWYCVGDAEFYGYTIKVDERVLIPRPETELLAENALTHINESSVVLDLCTGSGALAIAINKKTGAKTYASDISFDALTLARENAELNGANVEFIQSDLFENLTGLKFDVMVTNPPYIKTDDISGLQREIREYEPKIALDGGKDGLDFYRKISEKAAEFLNEKGVILLECGFNQAKDVAELFGEFSAVEIIKDYEGVERIVKAVL